METVKQYLLGILCAALVCSVLTTVIGKNKTIGSIIKMLCGIFLAVTVVSPITNWNFSNLDILPDEWDSDVASDAGIYYSTEQMGAIIKDQTQAYILDKAKQMGVDINIDVTLDSTYPYAPDSVVLSGVIGPYNKHRLMQIISEDLAIPEDKQIWK